jgi:putative DNA primase/helicase
MAQGRIRYSPEWRRWLMWTGKQWKLDSLNEIRRWAKQTIREFYAQAAGIADDHERRRAEEHARKSESAAAIRSMLACAEAEKGVPIAVEELDRDPWLLNCNNGTIDLRTGQLRPHRPADMITKLCPVDFDPDATCPLFELFVNRILPGGLVEYARRFFGYALTGLVIEKVCFCFFGVGNNGKTTLLELFRFILGPYAAQVMIDSLMTRRAQETNASLADLADLRGARFVTTSETEEGQRLAEGKLKYLTGMGEVKTCRKYENPITFVPTHKIFMDANHRPVVRGTDEAIWSRLKVIPFTVSIPPKEIDKDLLTKLKAEAPGVLAWAVRGCLAWQQSGLCEPLAVRDSVSSWKSEDDPYREFFEDRCEFDPAHSVPVTDMWMAFTTWGTENGLRYPSREGLQDRLHQKGCSKAVLRDPSGRQVRSWKGVKLR